MNKIKRKNNNYNYQMDNGGVLPTPPRSPASKSSSYYNSLPDPILEDLFQLLDEDEQDNHQFISRKRKISEISLLANNDMNIDNALLELGLLQEQSDSEASYLIDHLLSSYNANSPPPTNPPSPQHNTDYYDDDEDIKFNPFSPSNSSPFNSSPSNSSPSNNSSLEIKVKSEPIESSYDTVLSQSECATACSSAPTTAPSSVCPSPSYSESDSYTDSFLKDFESFDTFEKLAGKPDFMFNFENSNDSDTLSKLNKRVKLNSESNDYLLDNDCMWNAPLFPNNIIDSNNIVEEVVMTTENKHIQNIQAINNDHCYAANFNDIQIKTEPDIKINFDKIQKKTKILVPLKHLMETLQQKSYLVSPLGPGKKVIRLTGTGETVKGVFQSSAILTMPQNSNSKPSNHNVRKRPHNPILNTRYTSPKLMEPLTSSLNGDIESGVLGGSPPTKKKTKAHNNMERMRRIDLRNSFDNLKKLVPILAKSPKCSKVEILKKAEEYIRGLRITEKKLIKEEQTQKIKLQQLKIKFDN